MKRFFLATFALLVVVGLRPPESFGEGAAELGGNQGLQNTTVLYVDILNTTDETVAWDGVGDASVYSPSGTLVGTISSGGSLSLIGFSIGRFRIEIDENQSATTPWDVTVWNAGVPQTGRLHSIDWKFDADGFAQVNALTGSFYGLVPGGAATRDAVVEFRLDGMAGGVYQISANGRGVDGPLSPYSVPLAGNTLTPEFPIYLNLPVVANYNRLTADISAVTFSGGATGCTQIGPGTTQGEFDFSTSVAGTGFFICDLNGDAFFDPLSDDDLMLQFDTIGGANTFVWDGFDRLGQPVAPGTYQCRIEVNVGEFHYVANDIETSYPGTRFFEVDGGGTRTPLDMLWNDKFVQINAKPMPNGQKGLESSGPTGINAGDPSDPADPNVNARSWGDFSASDKGDNAYLDTFAVLSRAISNEVGVDLVDGALDTDSDLIKDVVEVCNIGTNPLNPDTDGDGISDTVETRMTVILPPPFPPVELIDSPIDFDGDGTIDALDLDSDDDGIPDAIDTDADTDGDDWPNFRDPDDDGDEVFSIVELALGTDPFDLDTDGDVINDFIETDGGLPVDTDTDGTIDALDLDSDDDGIADVVETAADFDLDGVSNFRDLDSDGDTIPDSVEGTVDSDSDTERDFLDMDDDGDGAPTLNELTIGTLYLNPDTDGDGINDGIETDLGFAVDTDTDGTIDALDLDSDDDTLLDADEGVGDIDFDGIPNFRDPDDDADFIFTRDELILTSNPYSWDSDGDGIFDFFELNGGFPIDTDSDGTLDVWDPDSDDDGIPDAVEGLGEIDFDGLPNFRDPDDDGDGIATVIELADGMDPLVDDDDVDGDLIPNWYDTNSDGDAFTDRQENRVDSDEDGIPNYLDPDSGADVENDLDSDGIFNVIENLLGTNPLNPDSDGDGIGDFIETNGGFPVNTDGDGTIDALDPDSDDDGLLDAEEGTTDTDVDGIPDFRDSDDDGDGIPTAVEVADSSTFGDDINGDLIPNWHDIDSDGDLIPDGDDGTGDADTDTIPNYLDPDSGGNPASDYDFDGLTNGVEWALGTNAYDPDSDGDGIGDLIETNFGANVDTDGDGTIDALDSDSDDDGIPDAIEGLAQTDSDGIPDFRDLDDDGDGVSTAMEVADSLIFGDDVNGDLILNWHDSDSDGDGLLDGEDGTDDNDDDGIPNYLDPDSGGPPPGPPQGTVQLAGKTFGCSLDPASRDETAWDLSALYLLAFVGFVTRLRRREFL